MTKVLSGKRIHDRVPEAKALGIDGKSLNAGD